MNKYKNELRDLPVRFQKEGKNFLNAYHLCVILVEKRKELYNFLTKNRIFPQVHYIPIYKQPYYSKKLPGDYKLKNAEDYYHKCLSLPLFYSLSDAEQDFVILTIKDFFGNE